MLISLIKQLPTLQLPRPDQLIRVNHGSCHTVCAAMPEISFIQVGRSCRHFTKNSASQTINRTNNSNTHVMDTPLHLSIHRDQRHVNATSTPSTMMSAVLLGNDMQAAFFFLLRKIRPNPTRCKMPPHTRKATKNL